MYELPVRLRLTWLGSLRLTLGPRARWTPAVWSVYPLPHLLILSPNSPAPHDTHMHKLTTTDRDTNIASMQQHARATTVHTIPLPLRTPREAPPPTARNRKKLNTRTRNLHARTACDSHVLPVQNNPTHRSLTALPLGSPRALHRRFHRFPAPPRATRPPPQRQRTRQDTTQHIPHADQQSDSRRDQTALGPAVR